MSHPARNWDLGELEIAMKFVGLVGAIMAGPTRG